MKPESKDIKLQKLKKILLDMDSLLLAFSGGVDSTFLLKVARDVLGDRVLAVTAVSPIYPAREMEDARRMSADLGVRLITLNNDALNNSAFVENPPDRCYWCKKELFEKLTALAAEHHLRFVADGTNHDDTGDYRPGMRAVTELGVRSPLREAGLTKAEVRTLSKDLKLPTWDKPPLACLASRFPYGTAITPENLEKVDRAERFLGSLGISQMRVRHHGNTARIEVLPKDMDRLMDPPVRKKILEFFKHLGYNYTTLDLEGYRTGSLNETLEP